MLTNATTAKLRQMRLSVMAKALEQQLEMEGRTDLTFEERIGLMVDAEWNSRKNNSLKELIRKANYSIPNAALEDVEYRSDRQLNKALINRLETCDYIRAFRNIIIMGATGSGKTYLANAFGMKASRNFITVRYIRLPDLLGELAIARAENAYQRVVKQYKQVKLLILDEWLLYPLKESESRDLLEIAEARYKRASTIFCSQFQVADWHHKIGEPTLADAICDRIVHDSYHIVINGDDSMRKHKGINGQP
jgi:DNA replication protein DnaC